MQEVCVVVDDVATFTVMSVVTAVEQPLAFVTLYVIVAVPAPTPITNPALSTVATEVLLLLQFPPVVEFDKFVELFKQTELAPVIAGTIGKAFTVTTKLAKFEQVVIASVTVYLIVVPPFALPVKTPALLIDATSGVKLLQTPLLVGLANVMVEPTQTLFPPTIGSTVGTSNAVTDFETVVTQPAAFVTV